MQESVTDGQDCYLLFDGYTDALALFHTLKNEGVGVRISPTPRLARSECGTSLLVNCSDEALIRGIIDKHSLNYQSFVKLPKQIDARRDTFC